MTSGFDYWQYLKLATELATSPGFASHCEDAKHRSAISRAYYAVHLTARTVSGKCSHFDVINWVRAKDRDAGDRLRELKLRREDADYDHQPLAYKMYDKVQECLDEANELLKIITTWKCG